MSNCTTTSMREWACNSMRPIERWPHGCGLVAEQRSSSIRRPRCTAHDGFRSTRLQNWRMPTSRRRRASSSTAEPSPTTRGAYARASTAQGPLARPTTLADGYRATLRSRGSTRCSTQPAAQCLRSSASPIAIPVRVVCDNCARRWRWSTVARNRRRRPSCGCCLYATDYLGPLLKSRSVAAVSIWAGPNARLESSTTVSNI